MTLQVDTPREIETPREFEGTRELHAQYCALGAILCASARHHTRDSFEPALADAIIVQFHVHDISRIVSDVCQHSFRPASRNAARISRAANRFLQSAFDFGLGEMLIREIHKQMSREVNRSNCAALYFAQLDDANIVRTIREFANLIEYVMIK
jgi:hypothetical protein